MANDPTDAIVILIVADRRCPQQASVEARKWKSCSRRIREAKAWLLCEFSNDTIGPALKRCREIFQYTRITTRWRIDLILLKPPNQTCSIRAAGVEFCDVTLTLKQGHQPDTGGWVKIEDLPNSADRSEQRPAQPGESEAERPNVSAAEFGILGDDPLPRCARPAPNPRRRAAIIADHRPPQTKIRAPSSRPELEITKKESATAPPATSPSCGQLPPHRPGRSSRSSRSDGIAPPSLARAREDRQRG